MSKSLLGFIKDTINKISKKSDSSKERGFKYHIEDKQITFHKNLEKNVEAIKLYLGKSDDVVYRYLDISTLPSIRAAVVFIGSLVDKAMLESSVLAPLTLGIAERPVEERAILSGDPEIIVERGLSNNNITYIRDVKDAVDEILSGRGILFINNYSLAISINILKGASKQHTEPKAEKTVKGPQQGFVEDIMPNIAMVRKRVKSSKLIVKALQIGKETKTEIRLLYMDNIADQSIVRELVERLDRIGTDGIVGSNNIEEYITDAPTSLFPTIYATERPDNVQALILDGRIALICDGSPFVLVIPSIITDFYSTPEEFYTNTYFASFNRLLGYFGSFILMFLPGIYIAISTFHQEMIPTRLALTLAGTRAGVPYPAFIEALLMELAFEALREASTRLPTQVGQAVSIVGALIIGQAAVEAGLVSPAVVIVVATTAIFSFTVPYNNFSTALRLTRFFNMALAATLGIYGIMTGFLLIALHLLSLRSFGIPFMVPFAPLSLRDMKDWVLRFPQWSLTKRSSHIVRKNIYKKSKDLKPKPIKEGKEKW